MTNNPTPAQPETLEPLTDREFEQMEQWAGADIADSQPYSDLMKLAVKTDAFLQRAIQEIRRTRRTAVAGPRGDAKFTPPAEDALHIAICQAVQEHHGPTANAILREALNDYKPTQLTRTELIRVQQRSGSGDVTAVMVSPAATSSPTKAHRCPHCGRTMRSDFDEDVGMWYECDNCDYREAVSSAPAERTRVEGEQWRQGMRDAAKEVCDACADEYRYGRARKIEGSTRWWHGEHADFQCEAGSIWRALEASAAAPADNGAELDCTCDDLTEVQRAQGDHYDDCPRAKGDH